MNFSHVEDVEIYVYQFRKKIKAFNQLLIETYQLDCEPTYNEARKFFPRMGVLISDTLIYNYQYHGGGCTFVTEEVTVGYDIDVSNNNEIKISAWKFNEFIKTYSKNTSSISINELDEIFLELVKKGVLLKRREDSLVFNINDAYFEELSE